MPLYSHLFRGELAMFEGADWPLLAQDQPVQRLGRQLAQVELEV